MLDYEQPQNTVFSWAFYRGINFYTKELTRAVRWSQTHELVEQEVGSESGLFYRNINF